MIDPVPEPIGTVTVNDVALAFVTGAITPLNFTTFSFNTLLKLLPVIVTSVSGCPDRGLAAVIDGEKFWLACGLSFLQENKMVTVIVSKIKNEILISGGLTKQVRKYIFKIEIATDLAWLGVFA